MKLPFEAITLLWFQSLFFRNITNYSEKTQTNEKCPFGHYEQQYLTTYDYLIKVCAWVQLKSLLPIIF